MIIPGDHSTLQVWAQSQQCPMRRTLQTAWLSCCIAQRADAAFSKENGLGRVGAIMRTGVETKCADPLWLWLIAFFENNSFELVSLSRTIAPSTRHAANEVVATTTSLDRTSI